MECDEEMLVCALLQCSPVQAPGVAVKRGVPADSAATAVPARARCFTQYDCSISRAALQTGTSAFIKHTYQ